MKTIITTITAAVLMITSLSSFAANPNENNSLSNSGKTISAYISSLTEGSDGLNEMIFAKEFEYTNAADVSQRKYSRKQYLKFLKQNKGLKFDCRTTFTLLDETGNTSVAKVTMQFEDFTRVDYITMHQVDGTWQVSKVVTSYPAATTR
ncbi:nuclear transport factor 2 family protein [Sphingobacterium corticis]|uniref:Nuclear transport factor 2 family protein n=1 Tax=Sphingobacterium corticis TaxID=1812823 RepID=A0ABW5NPC0_9SPHI